MVHVAVWLVSVVLIVVHYFVCQTQHVTKMVNAFLIQKLRNQNVNVMMDGLVNHAILNTYAQDTVWSTMLMSLNVLLPGLVLTAALQSVQETVTKRKDMVLVLMVHVVALVIGPEKVVKWKIAATTASIMVHARVVNASAMLDLRVNCVTPELLSTVHAMHPRVNAVVIQ
jgi:hypothetical protein